jgi:hypothetical protein
MEGYNATNMSLLYQFILNEVNIDSGRVYWNLKDGTAVIPLQAWSGPKGSRKLRFPDFSTTAQDGGKVVRLMHRPHLPPGNTPDTHFC